jgi:hypothetical protein
MQSAVGEPRARIIGRHSTKSGNDRICSLGEALNGEKVPVESRYRKRVVKIAQFVALPYRSQEWCSGKFQ